MDPFRQPYRFTVRGYINWTLYRIWWAWALIRWLRTGKKIDGD